MRNSVETLALEVLQEGQTTGLIMAMAIQRGGGSEAMDAVDDQRDKFFVALKRYRNAVIRQERREERR